MRTAHTKSNFPTPLHDAYAKDTSFLKTVLLAILLALIAVVLMAPPNYAAAQNATVGQPTNNCAPGDKIDGTTASDAQKKLEAAGYSNVTGLVKGCDNVWHGQARGNGGAQVNVAVMPDGSVAQETN
jgi:hypothetical protein